MQITSEVVRELREKTGVGMMDCKKALEECGGNMEKAVEALRKKGLATAAKRAGKEAKEGIIESYIHMNGKIGVLIQLNCETDFVARTDDFKALARNIAMHIAATNPSYVAPADVPPAEVAKEKEILMTQVKTDGKPAAVVEKIIEGKLKKFYSEVCLLEQPFVKDGDKLIKDLITDAIGKIGENITIGKFSRFAFVR